MAIGSQKILYGQGPDDRARVESRRIHIIGHYSAIDESPRFSTCANFADACICNFLWQRVSTPFFAVTVAALQAQVGRVNAQWPMFVPPARRVGSPPLFVALSELCGHCLVTLPGNRGDVAGTSGASQCTMAYVCAVCSPRLLVQRCVQGRPVQQCVQGGPVQQCVQGRHVDPRHRRHQVKP